jgi:hypothetical protein
MPTKGNHAMTNSIVSSVSSAHEAYETNVQILLEAQRLATEASLAGNLAGAVNSVPVVITFTGSWSFTVSCEMRNRDFGYYYDGDALVVDLTFTNVPVEDLVQAVEIMARDARDTLAAVLA